MRIVNWNCNGAFRKKFSGIAALGAEVYVIQECEDPANCKDDAYRAWASNYLWIGTNKNRGLGVFAKKSISLKRTELDAGRLELFLPCIIANKISLLAVWTREANSPNFRYIGQLWKFLQLHLEFLRQKNAAMIGDLNSNACWDVWDRWWNHSDVVKQLQEIGMTSLYHHLKGEAQGKETRPTFFMNRRPQKPYHIDYAFVSSALLKDASIEVGQESDWLPQSNHMPLIIDLFIELE